MIPFADEDLDAAERDARVDDAWTWLRRQREAREEHCAQTGDHPPRSPAEQTVLDLLDEVRRLQQEIAAASIARFRSVIDDFLRAPEMFARGPECGAHVVYGAMLASGGNGRTWYDACLAVGLARGNVAVAAQTWDDVRRLATHLHETAETWAVTS